MNKKNSRLSTRSLKSVSPNVKRYYKPEVKKRYTAEDLVDNDARNFVKNLSFFILFI
jgi:hypothetical protein